MTTIVSMGDVSWERDKREDRTDRQTDRIHTESSSNLMQDVVVTNIVGYIVGGNLYLHSNSKLKDMRREESSVCVSLKYY